MESWGSGNPSAVELSWEITAWMKTSRLSQSAAPEMNTRLTEWWGAVRAEVRKTLTDSILFRNIYWTTCSQCILYHFNTCPCQSLLFPVLRILNVPFPVLYLFQCGLGRQFARWFTQFCCHSQRIATSSENRCHQWMCDVYVQPICKKTPGMNYHLL